MYSSIASSWAPSDNGRKPYIIDDVVILSAMRRVVRETSLDIRECFESYCYTEEKCATCEEAYEDILDGEERKISMNQNNITFCSRRCLLNGWMDIISFLSDRGLTTQFFPGAQHDIEVRAIQYYIKYELLGSGNKCCDPLCSRLGYSQTDNLTLDSTEMNTSLLFMDPKLYCCRKHAISSKVMDFITTNTAHPSELLVKVDCFNPIENIYSELHNTYQYSPVHVDSMWFHTMFHAVAYYMVCDRDQDLALQIRKTMNVATVRNLVATNMPNADEEEEVYKILDTKMQQMLCTKMLSSMRMFYLTLYYHKTKLNYVSCLPNLIDSLGFKSMMEDNYKRFMDSINRYYSI